MLGPWQNCPQTINRHKKNHISIWNKQHITQTIMNTKPFLKYIINLHLSLALCSSPGYNVWLMHGLHISKIGNVSELCFKIWSYCTDKFSLMLILILIFHYERRFRGLLFLRLFSTWLIYQIALSDVTFGIIKSTLCHLVYYTNINSWIQFVFDWVMSFLGHLVTISWVHTVC